MIVGKTGCHGDVMKNSQMESNDLPYLKTVDMHLYSRRGGRYHHHYAAGHYAFIVDSTDMSKGRTVSWIFGINMSMQRKRNFSW